LRVFACRVMLGEGLRAPDGGDQPFVRVSDEGIEVAAAIARRNARVLEQTRRRPLTPAVAADDAADSIDGNGLPPCVVAALASHRDSAIVAPGGFDPIGDLRGGRSPILSSRGFGLVGVFFDGDLWSRANELRRRRLHERRRQPLLPVAEAARELVL